ncbi:MAG: hypothetical protein J5804_06085, partial [Eggerthellaceae bacterium]|nr:hypothetical protein [Eggerthellaceae bacterium]
MDAHDVEYEAGKDQMLPEWFFVSYRECGEDGTLGDSVEVHGQFGKRYSDDAMSLSFELVDDVLSLHLETVRDVQVEQCRLGFLRQFGEDARILLNGYQSWTDTVELPRDARMPGLLHVPAPVVRAWTLDGSGDYAFAQYTDKPGQLHGFTYLDVREGDAHE